MLSEIQIESYLESIHLPDKGRAYVRKVRSSEPSRSVTEGCFQNTSSSIYSEKMGFTVQSESGTGEYPAIFQYEYAKTALEYWEQLPATKVKGLNKGGRPSAWTIRPDFLILFDHGVEIHEVKADSFIDKRLAEMHPAWGKDESGEVHYFPAEEHFASLGIRYRVRPISSFNKILLSNQKLLLSSRQDDGPTETLVKKAKKALTKCFTLTMSDLMKELRLQDATSLIQMIDQGLIFCELEKEFLSDYENINLALTPQLSLHARSLREQKDTMREMVDISVSSIPSKKAAEEALNRIAKIESGRNDSTIRSWKKKVKDGEKIGISAFESLLPKKHLRGNRGSKTSSREQEVFKQSVDEYYANPKRPSVKSAYIRYKRCVRLLCDDEDPITERSYRSRIKSMDQMKLAFARGGKRMMYAHSNTSAVIDRALKSRVAFQRAHIDHHVVKCFILWGKDGKVDFVGRPWLSLLIDEATDMVVGYHFSFARPTRLADGCVLRDCVRRYGKLPEEIVADHGSDFKSVYFRSLLASEKVTFTLRPKSMSKAGSEVERFFNEFQTQWLCQRQGNMVNKHAARAVDGKFASRRMAVFQPEDLLWEFDQYIAHRNNKLRGVKTKTAAAAFKESSAIYGCVGRKIPYDEKFIVASAVESNEYSIERNDIKIDGIRYSHPELRNTRLTKSKLEVRVEPENPYLVYVYINSKWVSCAATGAVEFMEKSTLNQRIETLKIRGAGTLRALAQDRSHDELADLFNTADERLDKARKVGWIEIDESDGDFDSMGSANIFDQLTNVELHQLPTTTWSQP